MQDASEVGKYVTDGKHTYPYNAFLDELVASGKLKYCTKPEPSLVTAPMVAMRSPLRMTLEERTVLAVKLGVHINDLNNMSPQELAEAEAELSGGKLTDGFPA